MNAKPLACGCSAFQRVGLTCGAAMKQNIATVAYVQACQAVMLEFGWAAE